MTQNQYRAAYDKHIQYSSFEYIPFPCIVFVTERIHRRQQHPHHKGYTTRIYSTNRIMVAIGCSDGELGAVTAKSYLRGVRLVEQWIPLTYNWQVGGPYIDRFVPTPEDELEELLAAEAVKMELSK